MREHLNETCGNFITEPQKEFITAFTDSLEKLGYTHGGLQNGFCWGKYMIIYRRAGVKSKTVYARIYIRENSIVLRLFLNRVEKHAEYIKNSSEFIRTVFLGTQHNCHRCSEDCRFRKTYTIDGISYEKCSGSTFEFHDPTVEKLPEYLGLFNEFFARKTRKA